MEMIIGKKSRRLGGMEWMQLSAGYQSVLIDLGTGDGRFVMSAARSSPGILVIGIDACRENLRNISRSAPENALFLIANAMSLPEELAGTANQMTINFPWGSLLSGLLDGSPALIKGMQAVGRPGVSITIRLNQSALADAGHTLAEGGEIVSRVLADAGYQVLPFEWFSAEKLRQIPSSWAKRMAFGRQPEAIVITAFGKVSPDWRRHRTGSRTFDNSSQMKRVHPGMDTGKGICDLASEE